MPATVPGPRIAIVGGGIGGLAAGAFLHQAGFTATLYEQAHALTEVGAGLVMAPNAVRLLRRIGVMAQFLRRAVPLDWGWEFRRWTDGNVLSVEKLSGVCERLYGERTYVVHRADLLDSLKTAVPSERVRLGARCTAVDVRKNVVLLRFADGSQVEADIVIGADGVHSVVRGAVTEPSPPTYSGICAFRTIVPARAAPGFALRRAQTLWLGPGRHFVHYPVAGGQAVNVVAFAPAGNYTDESWSATATIEEFQTEFADWDPRTAASMYRSSSRAFRASASIGADQGSCGDNRGPPHPSPPGRYAAPRHAVEQPEPAVQLDAGARRGRRPAIRV
ncbi:FAD-dependent monooxygenase [Streptomyces sp. NPDC020597]|uniref:FAD-dependent monooxygenase n=1 Tax=unclassified Streptomyces TaxID=2593676 RepID=UPI0037AAC5CC